MASRDEYNFSTKTDTDGYYAFNNLSPGTYQVNLFVNGPFEQRQINNIIVTVNCEITGQDFAIASVPMGQISGIVTGPQGLIANASVTAFNQNLNGGGAITNADGIYTITGLPADIYDIAATADGYASDSEVGVVVTSGQTSPDHNFSLSTEGGAVSGFVFCSDGVTLIQGALVSCYSPGKSIGSTITDENGAYSISMLQAGSYDLTAISEGYVPETISGIIVVVLEANPGNNFTLDAQ